jgi:NAD(P)-dependent dehydrogenase (short-subunit alcohol dehydrogenase family)
VGKLQGTIAVITGGSSGIGLATAVEFVGEGAYVFITGRRQKESDAAAALIGRNVTEASCSERIVSDPRSYLALARPNRSAVVHENVWSAARLQGKSEVPIDRSAQMYSAFDGEQSLLAMMSCAACSS